MAWYTTDQQHSHVMWSKVRYTRNIASLPFGSREENKTAKFRQQLSEIMEQNGFHEDVLPSKICPDVLSLAEKQFVDHSFALAGGDRALYFNEPCSLTIYSGGDHHLNIQALLAGTALYEAYKIASEAEEMLDREFEFAYSDKLGYLAADPQICGSGIELSCALYLPTARHGVRFGEMARRAQAHAASLSPFLAKYDNAGDIYILSYIPCRVISEKKAILDFAELITKIIDDERINERIIFANKSTIICDRAWRALGTLASARSIDEEELFSLLSRIRLSLCLEEAQSDAPKLPLSLLSKLLAEGLSGSVVSIAGEECQSHDDCRIARAKNIKRHLIPICNEMIKTAI